MNLSRLGPLMAAAVCISTSFAIAQQPFKVVEHWKIGGTGGWDYLAVDPAAHRLYVTHNSRVEVVDTQTGKPVGAITGLKGTHGVAFDPDGRTGYISDGAANAVVIFDRNTFATLGTVPAGVNPDGITYEPSTKTVWAFNGRSRNVTVIDPAARSVVATIALPGKPEFPQADGQGTVFVNIEDKNSIVKLDARTKTVVASWPLEGCESPSGLALDEQHARLFAVCDGSRMAVVDSHSGKVLALPAVGDGPDAAAYDTRDQLAFSSNGDGSLTVIDTRNGYKSLQTLQTAKGARTMAYDAQTGHIYLATADYGPKPDATAANPRPRPSVVPNTFQVLVVGR